MTTLRQFEANQRNARKSTGPKPKFLKSGIDPDSAVLPFEDRAAHDALVAEHYARFRPTRPEERVYVDDLIRTAWLLTRLRRTETELTAFAHQQCSTPDAEYPLGQPAARNPKVFSALQWRINATRKARKEALDALRELRENPVPDTAA